MTVLDFTEAGTDWTLVDYLAAQEACPEATDFALDLSQWGHLCELLNAKTINESLLGKGVWKGTSVHVVGAG